MAAPQRSDSSADLLLNLVDGHRVGALVEADLMPEWVTPATESRIADHVLTVAEPISR
jgi:hypothetical protein